MRYQPSLQAVRRRPQIVPVADEQIRTADQELAKFAIGDIPAVVVDQPDFRRPRDPHYATGPQSVAEIADGFRRRPDVIERSTESGRDLLLQLHRTGIASGQAIAQRLQVARPGALALKQRGILSGKTDLQGTTVLLDRIEHGVGVEALDQHERSAAIDTHRENGSPAHMRQGQGHGDAVLSRKFPIVPHEVHRFRQAGRGVNDELGFAGRA
ncbi:hypothetical protein OZ411_04810 [Bradyrhizobium sp. Arg237L]|uniref:hypothetical protein n=1 Tax=Bradyrhizobium sp. Arg237L TaxID=3003352 RepID=UPI00249DC411|nr:hypothetical protein [Bradyrhizobium sp. Arg237L]MDI4232134.1 hypothetical protein [Bradyrhizobium sp. Arg237L]